MPEHHLRVLQLSDLHARGPRERDRARRNRVLGEAFEKNLDELLAEGPLDLVVFTGDAANWGLADEYPEVTTFLDGVRKRCKLDWNRLFVVPGNHDVKRDTECGKEAEWDAFRKPILEAERLQVSRWLRGGAPPPGLTDASRERALARQSAYRAWIRDGLKRPELLPDVTPAPGVEPRHPNLGYLHTLEPTALRPFRVHVVGLDSSWLCGNDNDADKILLTEDQLYQRTTTPDGDRLDGFRLALVHHPLSTLADGASSQRLLRDHVDLLLHGHVHDVGVVRLVDPDRALLVIAAGSTYDIDKADGWKNGCHVIDSVLDDAGRPLRYHVRLRSWSSHGHWYDDAGIYADAPGGRCTIEVLQRPDPTAQRSPAGRGVPLPPPNVHVLDAREADFSHPTTSALLGLLKKAYNQRPQARTCAEDAGVGLDDHEDGTLDQAWRSVLRLAAKQGRLRRLVENARKDDRIRAYHTGLQALLDAPPA